MKVYQLKLMLEEVLESLSEHYDDEELNVRCNTYRLPYPFIATSKGYISFNDMFKEDEGDDD